MAGQGRNADGLGTSGTLNVIRFPGDWYGPVEDLVPVGADAEPDEEIGVRVGATDRTADSFWGEDAQAVHQVDELADGRRSAASDIPWQGDRPVRAEAAAAQQPGTSSRSTLISWRRFAAPIVLVAMLAGAVVTLVGRDGDASRASAPVVKSHTGPSLTRSGRKPRHAAPVRSAGDRIAEKHETVSKKHKTEKHKTVSAHTRQTKASATTKRKNLAVSESTAADRPSALNDDAGTSHSSETSTAGTTPVGITGTKAVETDRPPAQTRPATTSSHTVSTSTSTSTSTPMSTKLSSSAPASGNALPSPTGLTP